MASFFRHDFKQCSCGACFVDGGNDYIRIGGNPEDYLQVLVDWRVNRKKRTFTPTNIRNQETKE